MEQIDPRQLLVKVVDVLNQFSIPHFITGGLAVFVWGRPRFTADIDIVVELKKKDINKLANAFKKISAVGYFDKDAMHRALKRRGEFNWIDGATGVKVDFWILQDDEFDKSRLERRVIKEVLGRKIYFTSPEDLILIKLKWYKETVSTRQLEDAESVLKISGRELDLNYLRRWARKLDCDDVLVGLLGKMQV